MAEFTIIDAGCRSGAPEGWYISQAEIIGFEPDYGECARLKAAFPDNIYVPMALDRQAFTRRLWITENPLCSSFYRPDESYIPRQFDGHKIIGHREVETVDIDTWLEVNNPQLKVDVLKLDTQGSELDILLGATKTLSDVSWVISEVEFIHLYEGQPLFADVDQFLRAQGFTFWNLMDVNYRGGQMIWADAYYVRMPNEGRILEIGKAIGCHP